MDIRPITQREFEAWRVAGRESYAADKEREGLSREDAIAEAEKSFAMLLPQGRETAGQHLYGVHLEGRAVGTLWWGQRAQGNRPAAWIYDIVLAPEHRGKGLGRRVMEWAQADAKAKGFKRLGLHVFGHNERAHALYRSLGFAATNIVMYKDL